MIIQLLTVFVVLSAATTVYALLAMRRMSSRLSLLEEYSETLVSIQDFQSEYRELAEENRSTIEKQSRRIAWLEVQVKKEHQAPAPRTRGSGPTNGQRPVIDRQRSRVLQMFGRGQDISSIASVTGMMPGEVELILNLHTHLAAPA